jgi:hypothetical protein
VLPTTANAATITHEKLDATTEIIGIEGNIVSGDLEQFRQISLRYPKAVVILNSDGGLIYPAIEIGKIIRITGYATVVGDNDVCASACALIWMAGSKRLLSVSGHVGFHASYYDSNGKVVESGAANALIGNYLTLLGASAKTIVFATTAPPDKVLWLTTANKEASGIDFESITSDPRQAAASTQTSPPIQPVPPPPAPPLISLPAPAATPPPPLPIVPAKPLMFDDLPKQPRRYMPHGLAPENWEGALAPNQPWVLMFRSTSDGALILINQDTFKKYKLNG